MPDAILYDPVCRVGWCCGEEAGDSGALGNGERRTSLAGAPLANNGGPEPLNLPVCRRNERFFSNNMQPGSRFAAWLKLAHKRPLTSHAFIMPTGYPCNQRRRLRSLAPCKYYQPMANTRDDMLTPVDSSSPQVLPRASPRTRIWAAHLPKLAKTFRLAGQDVENVVNIYRSEASTSQGGRQIPHLFLVKNCRSNNACLFSCNERRGSTDPQHFCAAVSWPEQP
jgi:hypothetical protein